MIKQLQKWIRPGRGFLYAGAVIVAGLALVPAMFPASAAADPDTSYYAIYCGQDSDVSVPSGHSGKLQCQTGSPSVEATVKSASTNPNGAHAVTIVEADCYPNQPAPSSKLDGNRIPCSDGPDATLTLGRHFPADPSKAGSPGGKGGTGRGGGKSGGGDFPTIPHTAITSGALPQPDATVGGPNSTFGKLLSILFGIIAAFALLNIVLSGMKYITSAGNPQRSGEAKNGIIFSLVGLMIAISAEAIIAFVINRASS